jgi:hypothetical protein
MRWRLRRRKALSADDHHLQAMTDLRVKDEQIDQLLGRAEGLVGEMQVTVRQASDTLRRATQEDR